ncbi:hypothetical protein QF028_004807 [Neobacillus sp. B4I6]|uniref:hypothetical protein n=1 Tax=Neobacillus sp. B4I6 TaxID=3373925 RepID=UPI003D1B6453
MDKKQFKAKVLNLLEQDVNGLTSKNKIKYMKKWIREYELAQHSEPVTVKPQDSIKVGILVQTTIRKIIRAQQLSEERIRLLQNPRYCKFTFDINYPFLKRVKWDTPLSEQRKINGYDLYWKEVVTIHNERYLICNDWCERNKPKFINWVKELEYEFTKGSR